MKKIYISILFVVACVISVYASQDEMQISQTDEGFEIQYFFDELEIVEVPGHPEYVQFSMEGFSRDNIKGKPELLKRTESFFLPKGVADVRILTEVVCDTLQKKCVSGLPPVNENENVTNNS